MMNVLCFGLLVIFPCVKGLQCPSCTYVTTTADIPSVFRTVVDAFLNVFSSDACSKPLEGPKPEVREETCSAMEDKESRCSFYDGTLILTLPIIGTEIPFKMYQRGCYYSLPANIPNNGCHDRDNINEDKTVLKQVMDGASGVLSSWGVANFKGKLCLCSDTYCKDISGASQGRVLYLLLFVAQFIALYAI